MIRENFVLVRILTMLMMMMMMMMITQLFILNELDCQEERKNKNKKKTFAVKFNQPKDELDYKEVW
jgi:hypothetical protein